MEATNSPATAFPNLAPCRLSSVRCHGSSGFSLCENGKDETALRKLILQMGDWQTKVLSFPVLGATSEKFILAIVLLDALLNGQGHERPIEAPSWQVRSVRCSLQS